MKDEYIKLKKAAEDKDSLSQKDIEDRVRNIAEGSEPHAALETADGKNNGAQPAVFKNQRKSRT